MGDQDLVVVSARNEQTDAPLRLEVRFDIFRLDFCYAEIPFVVENHRMFRILFILYSVYV